MDIISVLTYFGFTPQNATPLVVVAIVALFIVFKHTKPIRTSLGEIREKFFVVESRVSDLWKDKLAPASSPRQLNQRGKDILEQSGIKGIIASKKEKILSLVKEKSPKNAFDAEQILLDIVMDLPKHCPEMIDELKNGAFKVGADTSALLFVASISLRDGILLELGFKPEDLDKSKGQGV